MIKRRAALLSVLGVTLSACGFEPVYRPKDGAEAPSADLAAIEVKPIYERPGQILRQTLLARLDADHDQPRRFDLQVNFWITGQGQGVLNFTQPTRIRLVGNANWVLTARDTKQSKVTEGSERVIDGIDLYDAQLLAADMDNEHAQRRMAEAMAERIATRLAMWFHAHPTSAG